MREYTARLEAASAAIMQERLAQAHRVREKRRQYAFRKAPSAALARSPLTRLLGLCAHANDT